MNKAVGGAVFGLQLLIFAPAWAGQGFDPDLSVNGLFLGGYTKILPWCWNASSARTG